MRLVEGSTIEQTIDDIKTPMEYFVVLRYEPQVTIADNFNFHFIKPLLFTVTRYLGGGTDNNRKTESSQSGWTLQRFSDARRVFGVTTTRSETRNLL